MFAEKARTGDRPSRVQKLLKTKFDKLANARKPTGGPARPRLPPGGSSS